MTEHSATSNLVNKLRAYAGPDPVEMPKGWQFASLLMGQAADEIERLTAALTMISENDHLTAPHPVGASAGMGVQSGAGNECQDSPRRFARRDRDM